MSVRISSKGDESGTVVRVEGRLGAATVPELLATCRAVGSPLCLDLSGLRSADADGAEALRSLAAAGAELTDMSPHIRHLVFGNRGGNRDAGRE